MNGFTKESVSNIKRVKKMIDPETNIVGIKYSRFSWNKKKYDINFGYWLLQQECVLFDFLQEHSIYS